MGKPKNKKNFVIIRSLSSSLRTFIIDNELELTIEEVGGLIGLLWEEKGNCNDNSLEETFIKEHIKDGTLTEF